MVKVLFVCMGNICRSPTAEGVFRELVKRKGLSEVIRSDSAGTGDWHVGKEPDKRAQQTALVRGYDLSDLRARQAIAKDFIAFDYVVAMDRSNYMNLENICPDGYQDRLHMFLSFFADSPEEEVPDPYYGGPAGFDYVFDLVEEAAQGLIEDIEKNYLQLV